MCARIYTPKISPPPKKYIYIYTYIIGDGYQPNSRGLYTHYKDSLYIKGGMTIPNIRSLDPDAYPVFHVQAVDRS